MNLSHCFRPAVAIFLATVGCSNSSSPSTTAPDAASTDSQGQLDSAAPDSALVDSATPDSATPDSTTPDAEAVDSEGPDAGVGGDASALSFATDIYIPIIRAHCISCHGPTADGGQASGEAFGKLDMSTADAAYANLVNVAAQGVDCAAVGDAAPLIRVVPGDPATSLLYLKVNGYTAAPPCGAPMPKGAEIPNGGQATVVQQIHTWIAEGAQP